MVVKKLKTTNTLLAIILLLVALKPAFADEVKILASDFFKTGDNLWTINVTLKHNDTGWDHYADNWRVVDSESNILGERVLYHPHIDEQPFTRGLNNVMIPEGVTIVYIEAHDKVHGWTPNQLKVDLSMSAGGRLRIEAK
ncbi:MAG: hypothetical protein JRF02_01710 [Deltaproteobacteria bacterium]|jgi:hypothetical protein|nr:hypothetical protein [Deltaproteobacteria bacterium]